MSKSLVLAEKPSVGRDIARVLKCSKKSNGSLESDKYVVTWALGHLVTLADPEMYNEKYKTWKIDDLPMLPEKMKLVVIKESARQFKIVKELMYRKDINQIVIATDAGREGELVARWIIEKANVHKPIKRLWISSVTDKAIKEGFSKLRDGRDYENLYHSALSRAEADWYVGINATRALTCKYNAQLSCGRVQTPVIAIISKREDEIKNFIPKNFYEIEAYTQGMKLSWQNKNTKENRTFNKEEAENIVKNLRGKDAQIIDVSKTRKKSYAPLLYDLTELQRDANKIYGFSAKETLSIMQRLYENYKVLTYPRTDSRYIPTDVVDTLKDRVRACRQGPYSKFATRLLNGKIKGNSHFVDNSKISDHHAIIPTEESVPLSDFNSNERKIYDLVVKRFLSCLYPPCEYEEMSITAKIGDEDFKTKGKRIILLGYREIYENLSTDSEDFSKNIPDLKKGDILKVQNVTQIKGQTKPPAHFNEASLLSAMENPIKYMQGESGELKKIIGETNGLGTVATRADIIEKLFNTFLLERKGKDIFVTSKGKQLLELVPKDLKSPTMTAKWEKKLGMIAKGSLDGNKFIEDIKRYTVDTIKEIKASNGKFKYDNVTGTKCPVCGKYMLEVNGKHGKMLVCQDRECGYRKKVSQITNARCPNCHKKLELCGDGDGRIFVCSCGYREKLSAFDERKKKENKSVSKKEVQRYLKNQKKEANEPLNNALAEALSKLKF